VSSFDLSYGRGTKYSLGTERNRALHATALTNAIVIHD